MSQVTDYVIANASGATVRADINTTLLAVVSHNSGTAEPGVMYAFMLWVDTTNNLIKLRNAANSAWITLGVSITASNTVDINGGTIDAATVGANSASTIVGTTVVANTSVNIAGDGATVTGIKDEDNMASDSATKLATQQSIKAYVDSQVGTVDTLAEILANGNTTGGVDIAVSASDDITFTDSSKAIFGAGSDLQIYHDGSDSYIKEDGTGNLIIAADDFRVTNVAVSEVMIGADADGAVTLYHNNAAKLATTASGIDVTGVITTDGLTTSADIDVTGNLNLTGTNTSAQYIKFGDPEDDDIGNIFYYHSNNNMVFTTNTAEAMRIDSSGNVGIGTASTSAKLNVAGTSPAASSPATYAGTIQINETALSTLEAVGGLEFRGAVFGSGYGSKITGTDTGNLLFGNRSNNATWSERMRIDSSGNVGIGGTPGYPLNLFRAETGEGTAVGQLGIQSTTAFGSNPQAGITFTNKHTASAQAIMGAVRVGKENTTDGSYAGFMAFDTRTHGTVAAERMRIDSSGLVSIGNNSASSFGGNGTSYLSTGTGTGHSNVTIYSGTDSQGSISFADGTSGDTAYRGTIDYLHASDAMVFRTTADERMRIDSSGNVGIGVTSINSGLVGKTLQVGYGQMSSDHTSYNYNTNFTNNAYQSGNGTYAAITSRGAGVIKILDDVLTYSGASSGTAGSDLSLSERIRIDSSGNLLLGITTSSVGTARQVIYNDSSNIAQILVNQIGTANGTPLLRLYHHEANSSTAATQIQFLNRSVQQVGTITATGSATAFNTSSDYRLKENVRPIENGLDRLNNLNPVKFDWISDGTSSEGFIAHEAQEVFHDAVTGEKDAEMMQGMDYGRITPLLVKAIQEQQEQIELLTTEINNLKGE